MNAENGHLPPSDADLVRGLTHGSDDACHALVARYGPYLQRVALSLVGNAADAEDVLQETFFGAFRAARAFRGDASVKTWLVRILVRQAARCHRTRKRRPAVSLEVVGAMAVAAEGGDARLDVAEALAALSPNHREVLVLRELQGMSYEEIAAVLEVRRGTVESRLFRARQELKERLKDYLP